MNTEKRFGSSFPRGRESSPCFENVEKKKLDSRLRGNDTAPWHKVPEVWLVIALIGSAVVGSLGLVATALEHRDELVASHRPIASPLPPSHAQRPADDATP